MVWILRSNRRILKRWDMSPAKRNIFIVTYTENSPQQNSLPERRRNQNRQTETGALQNVCNLSENPCTHQMEWNGIRLSLSCLFFCSMCLLFGTIYKSAPQFSGISQNTPLLFHVMMEQDSLSLSLSLFMSWQVLVQLRCAILLRSIRFLVWIRSVHSTLPLASGFRPDGFLFHPTDLYRSTRRMFFSSPFPIGDSLLLHEDHVPALEHFLLG